jgi:hypothetical protein
MPLIRSAVIVLCTLALAGAAPSWTRDTTSVNTRSPYHLLFMSDRDGDADVYAVDTLSRRVAALTRNNVEDTDVIVAPSGHFFSNRYLSAGGVLISADGRRARRLGFVSIAAPALLSRDGRQLAISREDRPEGSELYRIVLVPVRGGPQRVLSRGFPDVFSRDGRYLAFYLDLGPPGLIDLRTGQRWLLPSPPEEWFWSPQLTRFAYLREKSYPVNELIVVGARPRARAKTVLRDSMTAWRWLDERRIGFVRPGGPCCLPPGAKGHSELVVLDVDQGTQRVLARGDMSKAAWSPTGGAFAYFASERSLAIVRLDGSPTRSVHVPREATLTWSPSGKRIALTGDDGQLDVLERGSPWRLVHVARGVGEVRSVVWSPNERMLALQGRRGVSLVPATGGRVRDISFVTGNPAEVIAWAKGPLPRAALPARPVPSTEHGGRVLRSRGSVLEIASNRRWAGAIIANSRADCVHVVAWRPGERAVRFDRQARCEDDPPLLVRLKLDGTRLSWFRWIEICGESCELTWDCVYVQHPKEVCEGTVTSKADRPPPRPKPPREAHRGLTFALLDGVVHVRGKADGRQTTIRVPTRIVDAELEDAGLFYAWNDARGSGRVAFIPLSKLKRRLA